MTADEKAAASGAEIERLKSDYRTALRNLNDSADASPQGRLPLLRRAWDCAQDLNNAVERAIVQTDLLSLQRSEVWATDLAATAFNVLETLPDFYTKMEAEFGALGTSCPRPSGRAFFTMQGVVPIYHPEKADELRAAFAKADLPIGGFDRPHNMKRISINEWIVGIIGVVMLGVILPIALWFTGYNGFNLWYFRLIAALGAAMVVGAFLPGMFKIAPSKRFPIRATGALGIFVAIFWWNPPRFEKQDIGLPPKASASGEK